MPAIKRKLSDLKENSQDENIFRKKQKLNSCDSNENNNFLLGEVFGKLNFLKYHIDYMQEKINKLEAKIEKMNMEREKETPSYIN